MLRLFCNFLLLAAALHTGAPTLAQQPKDATSKTQIESKAPANTASKSAPSTTKPVKNQSAKTPAAKSDLSESQRAINSKAESSNLKTSATVAASQAPKSKAAPSPGAKDGSGSQVNAKNTPKVSAAKAVDKAIVKRAPAPRPGLVPPPPPDTPTVFAGDGLFPPGFVGGMDYNNPAALAGRRKDVASQLASAKKLLADKELRTKELKEKSIQFEQLFSEGVISRRELESAQKDAQSAAAELNDARVQVGAYQNALSRLEDRIKPKSKTKSVATKKNSKVKAKVETDSAVKVAGKQKDASDTKTLPETSP